MTKKTLKKEPKNSSNKKPLVEEKDSDYLSVLMREQSENVLFQQKFWHEELHVPWWKKWLKKIFGV